MLQPDKMLEGKRILVTGGTGSLGKTLVRRLLTGELGTLAKIIVLSRDEVKQSDMRLSYQHKRVTDDEVIYQNSRKSLEFRLGDVRDYGDVAAAMRDVDVVVNAAALKQVPNCEYFPGQAILTNCIGPMNIVRAISEHHLPVETVVGISTDKACKPVCAMGMTKAIHERILISANILNPKTRFVCCRYGNVMASRGSVIPLFHEQIRQGGPVTVTVPKMTRFLMTLDHAVNCVFESLKTANPGETLVPRAPSSTILDVAKALIGDRNIKIQITGIRPGEKMHEIMVSEEECHQTVRRGEFYCIRPMLPELQSDSEEITAGLLKEFSSADTVISLQETVKLLSRHHLLLGQTQAVDGVELFEAAAVA
jgi:FlaA1/EpsC-like NDP-sugar epimerase